MPEILTMLLQIAQYLGLLVEEYVAWIYVILFCIIFSETGLVIFPFLPGDSLLFIAGAFGAAGSLDPVLLSLLLVFAAILGNTVNYQIGRYVWHCDFTEESLFLDRKSLVISHSFFVKYTDQNYVISSLF